ncbi:dehydrogenase/reductase SDR family member 9-like [Haemaphysalis longicornis]
MNAPAFSLVCDWALSFTSEVVSSLLFVHLALAWRHSLYVAAHPTRKVCLVCSSSQYLARRTFLNGLVDPKGKSVLITGCDTGFGHLLAKRLAKDGFRVYAGCLRSTSHGATHLKLIHGVRVLQLDVTREREVAEAFNTISKCDDGTELWAVVANAGIMTVGPPEWHGDRAMRQLFDVNVFGVTSVVLKCVPLLRRQQGRIVIVASMFGRMTATLAVPYCMSKHALVSFADGLRRRFHGTGLHVSTIEPTAYRTTLVDPAQMSRRVDELLHGLPHETQKNIHSATVTKVKAAARVFLEGLVRDDPTEVVRDMALAVSELWPKAHYKTGGVADTIVRCLNHWLPADVADALLFTVAKSKGVKEKINNPPC